MAREFIFCELKFGKSSYDEIEQIILSREHHTVVLVLSESVLTRTAKRISWYKNAYGLLELNVRELAVSFGLFSPR